MTGPYIAVCGPQDATSEEAGWAEEIGRRLAEAGAIVVCGGWGGVMEAVSRGARDAGGLVIGILPGDSRAGANPYLSAALPTGMGETRNALIVRAADTVIAVSGEFGTLSEIALALKMGKPVVGLGTWELSKDGRSVDAVVRATTPEDAVKKALELTGGSGG
ncbi:MAG: TIGR00725 family protein [Actinomycetota bacterium]